MYEYEENTLLTMIAEETDPYRAQTLRDALERLKKEAEKADNDLLGEVCTSAGILRAYKNPDVDQPGICVMFQPAGYEDEIDAAFVSVYENPDYASDGETPEDVAIMVYGDATTEEYTTKEVIRRQDVITGLGTGAKN